MLRADERGENNMSHGHGNHSAEAEVAAVAGEVGQGSKLDRARRSHGLQRRLHGARQTAQQRRYSRVPRADGSRKMQLLQAHVAQGIACGVQQRRKRVLLIDVHLRPLPGQVLFLAQHALVRTPQGVAPLEDLAARAEGCALADAHFHGKFHRNAT